MIGLLCFPVCLNVFQKRDLSVFHNIAYLGVFVPMGAAFVANWRRSHCAVKPHSGRDGRLRRPLRKSDEADRFDASVRAPAVCMSWTLRSSSACTIAMRVVRCST